MVSWEETAILLDLVQIASPPPFPPPNLDNSYNFFSDVEIQDLKDSLGLNIAKGTTDPRVEFWLPK